jgi:hypothetical protein
VNVHNVRDGKHVDVSEAPGMHLRLERVAVGKGQPWRRLLRGREVWDSLSERAENRLSEAQSFD